MSESVWASPTSSSPITLRMSGAVHSGCSTQ